MDKKLYDCLTDRYGNYMLPFFWQHGEDDAVLLEEISAIYESGIRALCVESRPHEHFCEDEWWHTMDLILSACEARGMKVWLLDDKHFPSGYANGIIPKKYPDERMWGMTERHIDVEGPQKDASVLCQWKTAPDDELLGIVACRRGNGPDMLTGETIDLTGCLSDDMVYFDLPEGSFRIVFLLKTRSGLSGSFKNYADKLTEAGGNAFLEAVYEPHWAHYSRYFGNTFAGFFSDEPCFGNNTQNGFRAALGRKYSHFPYTDAIPELLSEMLGEEVLPLLPALWFDTENHSMQKIRLAYMDVITALYSRNFTYKLGNWCREHGVEYIGHIIEDDEQHTMTGVSAGHYFRALDGQDMAGIDVVLCQILPGMTDLPHTVPCSYDTADPDFFHFTLPKLGASHAHIQPEKKGRAMCEIFGAYGWAEGLKMMKWLADFMMVRGINYFVPHAFSPKFPDPDCPPHLYAHGTNPQFAQFSVLMHYMNRICHLTNDTVSVAGAAVLYHAEAQWSGGACDTVNPVIRTLTEAQINCDIVPADYLHHAEVDAGCLVLGESRYPCLVIPYAEYLPSHVLNTLASLADRGLPLFFLKSLPTSAEAIPCAVPSGEDVHVLAETAALPDTLRKAGYGDLTTDLPFRHLRFYHGIRGGVHFYLLTNEGTAQTVSCNAAFTGFGGGTYVVYDAMENRAWSDSAPAGTIPVTLRPYESRFYIFGMNADNIQPYREGELVSSYPLECKWDIFTASQSEYPIFAPYRTTDTLFNLTGKDALPHFSGHIQYETTFYAEEPLDNMRMILDLGAVGETVILSLNGKKIGTRIAPPYRFDITEAVQTGFNVLVAEVINHYGYQMRDRFSKYLLFEPSGLLGPVTMEIRKSER